MWVSHISLDHVRNHTHSEIRFHQGFNALLAPNGHGKTNVVEAVAFFATLTSHRTPTLSALIQQDQEAAIIRMRVHRDGREVLLELMLNRNAANRAQINGNAVKPRELPYYFRCVVFAPEDLNIVRGEPSNRRAFLDTFAAARDPQLLVTLDDYERVVRQRNSLLKSTRQTRTPVSELTDMPATLEVWNEKLISLGTRIIMQRAEALRVLSNPLQIVYQQLVDQDHQPKFSLKSTVFDDDHHIHIDDLSETTVSEAFRQQLGKRQREERERGVTLVGPHRDDILFTLNGLPVKGFASHGETWSYVLALRLACAEVLREEGTGGDPVIILDDVFAELDARRRQRLLQAIQGYEQVLVTAAVENDVPSIETWHTIRIENGQVRA